MTLPLRSAVVLILPALLVGCALFQHHHPGSARVVIGPPYRSDGIWHYPRDFAAYERTGLAVIIPPHHDTVTADGEEFEQSALVAQSPVLPLPSLVRVTNLVNGRSMVVRVNDRGPSQAGRLIAVTSKVSHLLEFPPSGIAEVRVQLLVPESAALQASLQRPANAAAEPVAKIEASPLAPPPGAAGIAGTVSNTTDGGPRSNLPVLQVSPTGVVEQTTPVPGSLYVEIGGFGSAEDAYAIRARLGSMQADVVPEQNGDRTLYAIRVGPYHSVTLADSAFRQVLGKGIVDPEITVQ